VAHRDHRTLLNTIIPYELKENVGLEWGAYNWYISNIWEEKNSVLFTHDDNIFEGNAFDTIEQKTRRFDFVYLYPRAVSNHKISANGGRCFVLSPRAIKWLKERGGIWFDNTNTGQTSGNSNGGLDYGRGRKEMHKRFQQMKKQGFKTHPKMIIDGIKLGRRGTIDYKKPGVHVIKTVVRKYKHKPKRKILGYEEFLKIKLCHSRLGSFKIMTHDSKYEYVNKAINWLSQRGIIEGCILPRLTPSTWVLYNCFKYEFRQKVAPSGNTLVNSPRYSPQYYESLPPMSDKEIMELLENYPISCNGNRLIDGNHRVFAMMGRIVHGKSYLPMHCLKR
jgi:hypothetical protein